MVTATTMIRREKRMKMRLRRRLVDESSGVHAGCRPKRTSCRTRNRRAACHLQQQQQQREREGQKEGLTLAYYASLAFVNSCVCVIQCTLSDSQEDRECSKKGRDRGEASL